MLHTMPAVVLRTEAVYWDVSTAETISRTESKWPPSNRWPLFLSEVLTFRGVPCVRTGRQTGTSRNRSPILGLQAEIQPLASGWVGSCHTCRWSKAPADK